MTPIKLVAVEDAIGIVLPKQVLDRLGVGVDDSIRLVETENGVELAAYRLEDQLDIAEQVMRSDHGVLKRLAE